MRGGVGDCGGVVGVCVCAGVSAVKVLGGGEWVSPEVGNISSVLGVCPSISVRVNDDVMHKLIEQKNHSNNKNFIFL